MLPVPAAGPAARTSIKQSINHQQQLAATIHTTSTNLITCITVASRNATQRSTKACLYLPLISRSSSRDNYLFCFIRKLPASKVLVDSSLSPSPSPSPFAVASLPRSIRLRTGLFAISRHDKQLPCASLSRLPSNPPRFYRKSSESALLLALPSAPPNVSIITPVANPVSRTCRETHKSNSQQNG